MFAEENKRKIIIYFLIVTMMLSLCVGNTGKLIVNASGNPEIGETVSGYEDMQGENSEEHVEEVNSESSEARTEETISESSEDRSPEDISEEREDSALDESSEDSPLENADENSETKENENQEHETEDENTKEVTGNDNIGEYEESKEEIADSLCEETTAEKKENTLVSENAGGLNRIEQTAEDICVIPDKYNTGCDENLILFEMDTVNEMKIGDILIIPSGEGSTFVLDFGRRNQEISGTVYIENYDFSKAIFRSYHEDMCDREIKVVFNNCRFGNILTGRAEGNISYEYNNCSFENFSGSNAVFNRCHFGGTYKDGIVPFVDVTVNDCFFSDFTGVVTDAGAHIDGTQIYGIEGIDVSRVFYNNCRFEIPPLKLEGSAASVNACIMLQLEYSNANNVCFKDCRVNGGGYTVYAEAKYDNYTFENVVFDGISFGGAYAFGLIYPKVNEDIVFKNISETDSLYIGSVSKDEDGTHFSVTNDTTQERVLVIQTDKGIYEYTIPACYQKSEFTDTMLYKEFPFDLDIVIPDDCSYAVCFDNTRAGFGKQIRFVNWGDSEVFLSEEMAQLVASGGTDNNPILSGSCGKEITYTLLADGVLRLSGSGKTDDYHSAKYPEWSDYKSYIKEIIVEDGITGLGNNIFRDCKSLKQITLPKNLLTIGSYAFSGCVGLESFEFPSGITQIGAYALQGTVLNRVTYAGEDIDWDWVIVGDGNENWLNKLEVKREGLRVHLVLRDAEFVYTGSAIEPDIIVYNNKERLVKGVDYTVKYSNNTKASTAKKPARITVTGKGNLSGSNTATFMIQPKDISDEDVNSGSIVIVKGSKAKPVLTYCNRTLGTADYTITDAGKKYTEDGSVLITGKGNYTGMREIPVKVIEKKAAKKFSVTVGKEVLIYNGKSQKPAITVKDATTGTSLREKTDYNIIFANNTINAGTIKFTVVGIGNYSGVVHKSYKIKPLALKAGSILVSGIDEKGYAYVPGGVKISSGLKVTWEGKRLAEGVDYKISYSNNKKVSTTKTPAKYTISFMGNYKGSTSLKGSFQIHPAALSDRISGLEVVVGDKIYTGKSGTYVSTPIVSIQGVQLKTSDYKVTYYKDSKLTDQITSKNKLILPAGQSYVTVYVKLVGKGNYAPINNEYVKAEYQVCKKPAYDLSKARVTLWQADQKITQAEYTGCAIEPAVKVEVKKGKIWEEVPQQHYKVYYSNNIGKGTATVVISANTEEYAGSKTVKFKIAAKNIKSIKDLLKDLFGL